MPWTPDEAQGFTSAADTAALQQLWAEVANDRLEACLAQHEGEVDEEQRQRCEASAIRQANATVARQSSRAREDTMELGAVAMVDLGAAGKVTLAEALTLAREAVTLKATAKGLLAQLLGVLDRRDIPEALRKELDDVVYALRRTWADLSGEAETERNGEEPAEEQARKMVDGVEYPPSAFLVVEDPEMPTTWHLQVRDADGTPDHQLMGAAWAALFNPAGYRGNRYEGPDIEDARRKLRALYDSEDMTMPEETERESMAEMVRRIVRQELGQEPLAELAEADLREERGQVMELVDGAGDGNGAGPLKMRVVLIEPGVGNERDNHLYEADMLRRDAGVFQGVKMYTTDHKRDEYGVRTEVSQILKCPAGFTETGAPIAEVGVFDPQFVAMIRNREKLGILDGLHCSIRAKGKVKKGVEFGGRAVNRVEQIIAAESVDWVSQAGAGGRALSLIENSEGTEGTNMVDATEEKKLEQTDPSEGEASVEEATLSEAQPEAEPVEEQNVSTLSMGETLATLLAADLPDATKARIAERAPFATRAELDAVIGAERAYLAEVMPKPARVGPKVAGMGRRREPERASDEPVRNIEEAESAIVKAYLGR